MIDITRATVQDVSSPQYCQTRNWTTKGLGQVYPQSHMKFLTYKKRNSCFTVAKKNGAKMGS